MKNEDLTKLDWFQAAKRVIEDSNDAFRVTVASGSEFEIALDSSEDSVMTVSKTTSGEEVLSDSTPTGEFLVLESTGFEKAQVYVKVLQEVTSPQAIKIEVSPTEAGDFWVDSGASVTPDTALDSAKSSNVISILSKRVRLVTDTAMNAGEVQVVLLLG